MLGWEVIPRIPIGNLSISPHGVGIAVGYFLGATLMARRARRTGFDEDHAWNAAVVGVLGAIVGARTAYIIGHASQFSSPLEYLQIYKGGISLAGGLIGGFLTAWIYCRVKKVDFLRLADLGAPGLAIGTAVGRIGDLVIGDHLGRTTQGFWGWEYRGGELISRPPCDPSVYPSVDGCIQPGMVVHQTALYDSVWALIIFLLLMGLDRKPRPKGFLVFTWAALYSMGRIVTDFTRVDKTWFGTGLTGSQLTAIAVLLLSLIALTRLRKRAPASSGAEKTKPAKPAVPATGGAGAGERTQVVETPPAAPEAEVAAASAAAAAPNDDGVADRPVPGEEPGTPAPAPPEPETPPAAPEGAAEPEPAGSPVAAPAEDLAATPPPAAPEEAAGPEPAGSPVAAPAEDLVATSPPEPPEEPAEPEPASSEAAAAPASDEDQDPERSGP